VLKEKAGRYIMPRIVSYINIPYIFFAVEAFGTRDIGTHVTFSCLYKCAVSTEFQLQLQIILKHFSYWFYIFRVMEQYGVETEWKYGKHKRDKEYINILV
jgi:hypothetical protein